MHAAHPNFIDFLEELPLKKHPISRALALLLAAAMLLSLCACAPKADKAGKADVVNIGATGALGSLNPLLIDSTWINLYAVTLLYSPLAALNADASFDKVLASTIETEDHLTYTVRIRDEAKWSDGEPITAEDVKWTMMHLASPVIANPNMMLHALVGTDDETGYLPEGATDFEGVQVVDEKTVTFTFKEPMNMLSFLNGYAQYIFPLPKHILQDVPEDQLATYDWFSAPTVVSGPYKATSVDANHYITYEANENYWRGAPQISHVNIRIVSGSELLAGLKSGEIDIVPPLLGSIPETDYKAVQALENVDAAYGDAYAVESLFLNTELIPDARVRRAMLLAIDRQALIDGLLSGAGDICDGFAVPAGPYASGLTPTACDIEAAKALIEEAKADGWDGAPIELYLNAGEPTLANAAALVQNAWKEIGVEVKITTVDLDTLMTKAGTAEAGAIGVQYTYPPADPSWDIQWVLEGWCHYYPEEISGALTAIWNGDGAQEQVAAQLAAIDAQVQQDVPVINLYVAGPLGAVSKRLSGAQASMYGSLLNIHEWTLSK